MQAGEADGTDGDGKPEGEGADCAKDAAAHDA